VEQFVQQFVNAVSLGGIYALLALGLAMVFSIMGLINFAHGELMTIGGYALFFSLSVGLPFGLAALVAIAAATLAAALMERVAFRPVRGAGAATLLLTSFAVSIILQILFQNLISARPKAVRIPEFLSGAIEVGSYRLSVISAVSIGVTALMLVALVVFLRRTLLGIAMRAAAENFSATRLMGIEANRVVATAFALSGLLAGVSAILWVAQRGSVDPLMGLLPVLKAFIAVVVGGLGSLTGAVAGGFLLGFIEVTLQAMLPGSLLPFTDAFVLSLVIAVLLIRPQGLLARSAERVA
jgi:branched-chain amino acid transport system permease protein